MKMYTELKIPNIDYTLVLSNIFNLKKWIFQYLKVITNHTVYYDQNTNQYFWNGFEDGWMDLWL